MLSYRAIDKLGGLLNVGHFVLGKSPYYWNGKARRFSYNPSIKYKILYRLQLCISILYQLFLVYRCVQTLGSEEIPTSAKFRGLYVTICVILMNLMHPVEIKHQDVIHECLNNVVNVTASFQDDHGYTYNKQGNKNATRFINAVGFLWFFVSFSHFVACIRSPGQIHLLTSLVQDAGDLPIVLKIFAGLIHFYMMAFQTGFILTYDCLMVYYIYAVLPMMRRMGTEMPLRDRSHNNNNRNVQPRPLNISEICKFNAQLNVLQKQFNCTIGEYVLGAVMICTYIGIMCIVQAVIYDSLRSFVVAILVILLANAMWSLAGSVHEVSKEMQSSWKNYENQPGWFKKYRTSQQPQRMTIGSFFYIDKAYVLTFMSLVVSNAVDLIVTYRHRVD